MQPTNPSPKAFDWVPIVSLLLSLVAVLIVYFTVPGDAMDRLKVVTGYVILILVFFFGLMVLIGMARGTIDLKYLISEPTGHASVSRFQLLIFTFVIGLSIFLIIAGTKPPKFPAIPADVLTLLGISASTYAVSKGIQFSRPEGVQPPATNPATEPQAEEKKG
ncbi:MAG: hypothetical protein LAP38_02760 [Acidobacteriia bacterium]|nr:hypothetical protein [Terriglobia bacterium]